MFYRLLHKITKKAVRYLAIEVNGAAFNSTPELLKGRHPKSMKNRLINRHTLKLIVCAMVIQLLQPLVTASAEEDIQHPAFLQEVIILDAGHGGIDGGTSFQDILEKDINLAIAKKVFILLRSEGYNVILNRTGDYALSDENNWLKSSSRHRKDLAQRKELSHQVPTQVVVSLHVNWAKNTTKHGPLVLHQNEGRSLMLASAIQQHLNTVFDTFRYPTLGKPFYLLNMVADPAVIVEMGFISSPKDRAMLCDPRRQLEIAEGIADGIIYYLTAI